MPVEDVEISKLRRASSMEKLGMKILTSAKVTAVSRRPPTA